MYLFYLPFGLSIIVSTTAETSRYEFVSPFSLMIQVPKSRRQDTQQFFKLTHGDHSFGIARKHFPSPYKWYTTLKYSIVSYGHRFQIRPSVSKTCVCVCVTVCVCVCVLLNVLYDSELTEAHTVITVSSETRRRADEDGNASPLTQGGNTLLFDDGKGGGYRRADSRCTTTRPPVSH